MPKLNDVLNEITVLLDGQSYEWEKYTTTFSDFASPCLSRLFTIISDLEIREAVNYIISNEEEMMETGNEQEDIRRQLAPLADVLASHWDIIRGTDLIYPHSPTQATPHIALATIIQPFFHKSIFELLMPSIVTIESELTGTSLRDKEVQFQHFVLSDDSRYFIEIDECLKNVLEDGILKHTCLVDGKIKPLSEAEAQRVINHSQYSKECYKALQEVAKIKKHGLSIGAYLDRLRQSLEKGSVHKEGSV